MIAGIIIGVIVLVLVLAIIVWLISTYNTFIRLRNGVDEAFSTMDVYLKKRYDLVPNLVEIVKGYTKHENDTLVNVVNARNSALKATTTEEKLQSETAFNASLKSLFALHEAYPELKADKHYMELMGQLKSIEAEIAQSRKYYNGVVKQYNIKRETFPSSIVANWKKFEKRSLYEVESNEERQNVKVQF